MSSLEEAYYGGILVGMILVIVFLISIKIISEIMNEYESKVYRETTKKPLQPASKEGAS